MNIVQCGTGLRDFPVTSRSETETRIKVFLERQKKKKESEHFDRKGEISKINWSSLEEKI
jgi:hypothetical protein